jgi:hypothetical protein
MNETLAAAANDERIAAELLPQLRAAWAPGLDMAREATQLAAPVTRQFRPAARSR